MTPVIHSHTYQHFDVLQLSAKDFYTMLEQMIREYQYPDVSCKITTIKERGLFSSKREYLRISNDQFNYYVCACPFGKSFFISWILEEAEGNSFERLLNRTIFGKANREKTFYERDTELIFVGCITSIIKRAITAVVEEKGHRVNISDTQPAQ